MCNFKNLAESEKEIKQPRNNSFGQMLKGMEKGKMVPRGSANRYARNISGDKSKGLASG